MPWDNQLWQNRRIVLSFSHGMYRHIVPYERDVSLFFSHHINIYVHFNISYFSIYALIYFVNVYYFSICVFFFYSNPAHTLLHKQSIRDILFSWFMSIQNIFTYSKIIVSYFKVWDYKVYQCVTTKFIVSDFKVFCDYKMCQYKAHSFIFQSFF